MQNMLFVKSHFFAEQDPYYASIITELGKTFTVASGKQNAKGMDKKKFTIKWMWMENIFKQKNHGHFDYFGQLRVNR